MARVTGRRKERKAKRRRCDGRCRWRRKSKAHDSANLPRGGARECKQGWKLSSAPLQERWIMGPDPPGPPGQGGRGWRGAAYRLGKAARGIPMTSVFLGRLRDLPGSPKGRRVRLALVSGGLGCTPFPFRPPTEAHRQGRSPVKGGVHRGTAHTPVRAVPRWTGPVDREPLGRSVPHSAKNTAPTRVGNYSCHQMGSFNCR